LSILVSEQRMQGGDAGGHARVLAEPGSPVVVVPNGEEPLPPVHDALDQHLVRLVALLRERLQFRDRPLLGYFRHRRLDRLAVFQELPPELIVEPLGQNRHGRARALLGSMTVH
jgi:hypothetical protein